MSLLKRHETDGERSGGKLIARLHAWWEGYEAVPEDAAEPDIEGDDPDATDAAPEMPPPESADAAPTWSAERIAVTQQVWGAGMTGPLDGDEIVSMVKPLALNDSKHILDIGSGLGGPARAIAGEFGVWITGYESDAALAAAATEDAKMAGLGKRARVHHADPFAIEFEGSKFDGVFSKDVLFGARDKAKLLKALRHGLKDQGSLFLIDYVVREAGLESTALDQWRAEEAAQPYPWSEDQYRRRCAKLKLDIRVCEDMTEQYIDLIQDRWRELQQRVAAEPPDPALRRAVIQEAALWSGRRAALGSGDLRVIRLHALKRIR